jgi:short-subunit dehydrogenase
MVEDVCRGSERVSEATFDPRFHRCQAATKAYVQSLAEGLRAELAPSGVDVLASAPGPVHSGFAERAGMRMGMAQLPKAVAEGTLGALDRLGTTRPGWLAKLLGWSLALLPRWARVRVMTVIMRRMSRDEHSTPSVRVEPSGA